VRRKRRAVLKKRKTCAKKAEGDEKSASSPGARESLAVIEEE